MQAVIIPEIQNELNELAQRYAKQFDARVKQVLRGKKFFLSGQLERSVSTKVILATATTAPRIELTYADHGDFMGNRKLIYTKMAPADQILDFVRSGRFRLKSVPGYASGVTPKISLEKQQKRIAFAIAASRFGEHKNRPKRWKKLALPQLLREMNEALAQAWANKTAELLAQSLTTKPKF